MRNTRGSATMSAIQLKMPSIRAPKMVAGLSKTYETSTEILLHSCYEVGRLTYIDARGAQVMIHYGLSRRRNHCEPAY